MKKKQRPHNSVYVAIAGSVVNRRSVHPRNFVLNGKGSASNPLLLIHTDRYQQGEKKTQQQCNDRKKWFENEKRNDNDRKKI